MTLFHVEFQTAVTSVTTALPNWKEAVLAVKDQRLNQELTELTVTHFSMFSPWLSFSEVRAVVIKENL